MVEKKLLQFNVLFVKLLNLWPNQNGSTHGFRRTFNDSLMVLFVIPSFIAVVLGLYFQLLTDDYNLSSVTESLISITCCVGFFYVVVCFVRNRDDIMNLVEELNSFKDFGTPTDLLKTDRNASMFTILFVIYGMIGTLVYSSMPYVSYQECLKKRSSYMKQFGVPCGLVITEFYVPVRYDYSPFKETVTAYQIMICTVFSTTISILTMLMVGLLMHISTQLRFLGANLENIVDDKIEEVVTKLRECVRHHTAIILFADKTNKAFGSMMMLHITVTSFVISILGYQVLLTDNYTDSLRYGLHLGGWLVLLFLVSFTGQGLIDQGYAGFYVYPYGYRFGMVYYIRIPIKFILLNTNSQRCIFWLFHFYHSTEIARNAYSSPWYRYPPKIRRDILLVIARSQRPLTLNALNFGVMSLSTFLQVMSTAYSYFTLLVKMRS